MKVLHITSSLDKSAGGPSRSVPQTCLALAKLGVEIEIICLPSVNPVKIESHPRLHVTFMTYKNLIRFAFQLRPDTADLIHIQHVWTPYLTIIAHAARMKGIPYIITPRGMLEPWIMAQRPWKKKIGMALYQRRDLRGAVLIHSTCEMEKENILALGFTNRMAVIPNGIDLEKLPSPKQTYGSKKIVFLSRIHAKKGIELLLKAWNSIKNKGWTLEIAGDGEADYVTELKQLIVKDQIENVLLVGSKYGTEKWALLKSADLFILPTFSENFGIVVAEALVMGVPVITTKGTPWKELETKNCGWWIDLTEENLKKAMIDAMSLNSETLREMGENGHLLVKNNYEIGAVALHINRLYQQILV